MTSMVFLALSILGLDLLIYFLFQWTYGERRWKQRRRRARGIASIPAPAPQVAALRSRPSVPRDFPGQRSVHLMSKAR